MPMLPTGTSISRSGFTLIELMVVIVVLALIGLISLPLLANRGDGDERLKLRRITGVVKQLYNEATLTRDEHLLTFDFNRNSILTYRLRSSPKGIEKEPFGREVKLSPLQLNQIHIEGKGAFSVGQVSVRVFPLGWMEPTRLVLDKENGNQVHLTFSPLTGSVTIDVEPATVQ